MPRQKLPEGWRYDNYGNAGNSDCWFELFEGTVGTSPGAEVPPSVALAVIRNNNAHLDPVYEAAKRVVEANRSGFFDDAKRVEREESIRDLAKLIESMEEP